MTTGTSLTNRPKGSYLPKQLVNGTKVSGREYQVFCLIGKGLCVSEIANRLCICEDNVDAIKQALKKKLNLRHHTDLISYATREQVKREIKDGDFVRDDLLAEYLHWHLGLYGLTNVIRCSDVLDWILDFRLLTTAEAWAWLKERIPDFTIRRPE